MFPNKIPSVVLEEPRRASEIKVYNSLNKHLNDKYYVFYSRPWHGIYPDGTEVDGEVDFLVAHAEKGILFIEVKGGQIELSDQDEWYSTDRYGIKRTIKDPVQQAMRGKHEIFRKLRKSRDSISKGTNRVHSVILPDVESVPGMLRANMPSEIFAYKNDMNNLDSWVAARLHKTDDASKQLGTNGIEALINLIAKPVIFKVKLATLIEDDLNDFGILSDDQTWTLKEIGENNQLAIAGAAGTGKTLLAIQKAIDLSERGEKVLLLCYNRPLALHLQEVLREYSNLDIYNFHQFSHQLAIESGNESDGSNYDVQDNKLIEYFVDSGREEYDALIIDEGQDFKNEWLVQLEAIVKDQNNGVVYIFYDDNQNVRSESSKHISNMPLAKHRLTKNMRNSQCIHKLSSYYYLGDPVRAVGPVGIPPKWKKCSTENDFVRELSNLYRQLVRKEGIKPENISVLFQSIKQRDELIHHEGLRLGAIRKADAQNSKGMIIDTIQRFKGLESAVVIIMLMDQGLISEEIFYTALSRAQSMLFVLAKPGIISTASNHLKGYEIDLGNYS